MVVTPALQDLKAKLKEAGLAVTGNKAELVERLLAHVQGAPAAQADEPAAAAPASAPAAAAAAAPEAADNGDAAAEAKEATPTEDAKEGSAPPSETEAGKHAKIVFSDAAAKTVGV